MHYGLIRKTPDPREPRFVPSRRMLATLPDSLDLSAGMGPYLDQGALGSCGPNAAAECINFDQSVEGLPVYLVSRLFIYYVTRYLMGDVAHDTGVENKTMLTALSQYGFPSEALEPYVIADFAKMPTPADYAMALPNKLVDYAVVPQTLAGIKGVLVARRPFIFGFEVFAQIESAEAAATGLIRTPMRGASPIGGHDMTAVGYNLSGHDLPGVLAGNRWPAGTLKLRQHWTNADGTLWGDGGYGYISMNGYVLNPGLSGDFWVMTAIPTPPVPVPPTPPVPSGRAGKVMLQLTDAVPAGGIVSFDLVAPAK